jgi:NADH-quinone oxidoreductase subunit C
MRQYRPKDNVQKKAYHTSRFYQVPTQPRFEVQKGSHFDDVVKVLGDFCKEAYISLNQLVVYIDATTNKEVLTLLRDECGYAQCSELSAIDYLAQDGEFEIFYQLLNLNNASRMRVKCRIKLDQAIESVVDVYKSANFAEREMYDMFGIYVNNHPLLKRILMPEDWQGHPLLKTYPLQGDEFASWYEVDKIFGKEYRDVIGPENRDPSRIDRYDTKRFSRVGYEVPFGADISEGEKPNPIEYSETVLVDYNKSSKQLDERR